MGQISRATNGPIAGHRVVMDEQCLCEPLELQRLTREPLNHLNARFDPHEVALVLWAMVAGAELRAKSQNSDERPEHA